MSMLLLDIDGVIVRDEVVLDHVKHNIVRYVNKKLPMTKSPSPTKLNSLLYRAYGHTAKGLEREFGIDTRDFNEYVYTPSVVNHLCDFLKTDEFETDAKYIRRMYDRGWDIALFSNSPLAWSEPVREAIGIQEISNDVYSKPDLESYLRFSDKADKVVVVDDKLCNLMPTLFFPHWTPVHFSQTRETNFIRTIGSMHELINVIP